MSSKRCRPGSHAGSSLASRAWRRTHARLPLTRRPREEIDLKLTVLGAGTCMLSPTRGCSGYLVESGGVRLRLDAGAGTMHTMARLGLPWETITHQFISHFLLDHSGELAGLLWCLKHGRRGPRTAPLEILGPRGLRALLEQTSQGHGGRLFDQEFPVSVRELAPGDAVALGDGITLSVAKTPHTDESVAVRVEAGGRALGYTGDTAWSDELPAFFGDVDLLVAECSYLELPRGSRHLDLEQTASLAREAGARRLIATHFYFDPDEARLAERLAAAYGGGITVASDGVSIE